VPKDWSGRRTWVERLLKAWSSSSEWSIPKTWTHWTGTSDSALKISDHQSWQRPVAATIVGNRLTNTVAPGCWASWRPEQRAWSPYVIVLVTSIVAARPVWCGHTFGCQWRSVLQHSVRPVSAEAGCRRCGIGDSYSSLNATRWTRGLLSWSHQPTPIAQTDVARQGPRCVHGCNGRRQNGNFMFDDLLHLLTWTKPPEDCLCQVQT